ncbi:hypothetical protein D9M68_443560 [compost metagenome]
MSSILLCSASEMVSQRTGVAMNNDEYVPTMIPTSIANINPRIDSPPKINMINNTMIIVNEVFNVLDIVVLTDLFTISLKLPFVLPARYSRILSNTITVSFIEYPITVRIAAMKCWSISMWNGMNL